MKKLSFLAGLALAATQASAANVPVNIVYPIMGHSYNNYFTSSFSVTCPGGSNVVEWALDGNVIGRQEFYDQTTVQFSQKLPQGTHTLYVKSTCGADRVKFDIL